jgi:L-threonylcarbamoyladenylate synthase
MKTEIIRADHPTAIEHAADTLRHGGLVAFPTDTVYGLAALPFKSDTVERLYVAKGRSSERAIAVLIGDVEQLKQVTGELSSTARRLAERYWPGPLTIIVPRLPALPDALTPTRSIGVRIPDHPTALQLLRQVGPLAVTSANLSGTENPLNAQQVFEQMQGRIHLILDGGAVPGGVPSTVVDCSDDKIVVLRIGPIDSSEIECLFNEQE